MWLWNELAALPRLKLLVLCGNEALGALLGLTGIQRWHAKPLYVAAQGDEATLPVRGDIEWPLTAPLRVLPILHPAAALRRPELRALAEQDVAAFYDEVAALESAT